MDQSKARSGLSTQTKIQIRFEYLDMDPDLEASSGLDLSRHGASRGTQKWIRSTPRWIKVDRVELGSTTWNQDPLSGLDLDIISQCALVDEPVDELLLSIEMGGAERYIDLDASNKYLNVNTIWLNLIYPRKRTFFC